MIRNVLEFLEKSAACYPEKEAFSDNKLSITYRQLEADAKAVGSALLGLHKKNRPIVVYLDKNVACVTAFMGVVYSGNFYVSVDIYMPVQRIQSILETLDPVAVITDQAHRTKVEKWKGDIPLYIMEEIRETPICHTELDQVRRRAIDTDPLYALFTSGSTGVPKGTVICHRSVIAYAQWVTETFDITHETIYGNQAPLYFSMSVLDFYSTLMSGATMHLIPAMYFSFPLRLLECMQQKKINTIYWVPSALSIVANMKALDRVELPDLKKILFAGEVMPVKQLNVWRRHFPEALFANLYGPTEITDICTYYIVDREFEDHESLPIGIPCANTDILIITEDGREAADGEEGELCVRGTFLAHGYYNNAEKTEQVFVQNPLNPWYPELIYKTGDLVKKNERGEIIYLTRKDFQIKHMGYRIELGEIEAAVSAVESVQACACVYDAQKDEIVLFYQGTEMTDREMIAAVRVKLPAYMHPNRIIHLQVMPHNANGKIDRVTLKSMY